MNSTNFQFEKLEQEKQRLASLRKYESLVSDTDEDLNKLVNIAAYICQTPISLVNLIEANHTIFKAAVGTDLKGSPREISFCARAIMGSGVFEVQDASVDERFKDNPLVTGATQIRYYAGSPLTNKDGMNMGTLCVFDVQPKILSPEQREALQTLGDMAVMVIENRKQSAVLQKGNLFAVLALENKVTELMKQLEGCRKYLPIELAKTIPSDDVKRDSQVSKKNMVILQCTVSHVGAQTGQGEEDFSYLTAVYSSIANAVSNYHGVIHQMDGVHITALFFEPLSTFPHEENALYCAFELIDQVQKISLPNYNSEDIKLTVSMHSGDVHSAPLPLPTRVDYTIFGNVLEESKLIRDTISSKNNTVYISSSFYARVDKIVESLGKYEVPGVSNLEAIEVKVVV